MYTFLSHTVVSVSPFKFCCIYYWKTCFISGHFVLCHNVAWQWGKSHPPPHNPVPTYTDQFTDPYPDEGWLPDLSLGYPAYIFLLYYYIWRLVKGECWSWNRSDWKRTVFRISIPSPLSGLIANVIAKVKHPSSYSPFLSYRTRVGPNMLTRTTLLINYSISVF